MEELIKKVICKKTYQDEITIEQIEMDGSSCFVKWESPYDDGDIVLNVWDVIKEITEN